MKRLLAALALAVLALSGFAANFSDDSSQAERTELQSGYRDPA
jgi:hypothetical protein